MLRCILCKWEVETDDIAILAGSGRVICVRCFDREVGDDKPMPRELRVEVTRVAGQEGKP